MNNVANEELTIESFGEMFVSCRLQDGLFSDEGETSINYIIDGKGERRLSANDFARELGNIMLPFLSSYPDIGFEFFRKSLRRMVKNGQVICHKQELIGHTPFNQIWETLETTCNLVSKDPEVILMYLEFGEGQGIKMLQYKNLKLYMLSRRCKCSDIFTTHNKHKDEMTETRGRVYVWVA